MEIKFGALLFRVKEYQWGMIQKDLLPENQRKFLKMNFHNFIDLKTKKYLVY